MPRYHVRHCQLECSKKRFPRQQMGQSSRDPQTFVLNLFPQAVTLALPLKKQSELNKSQNKTR
jgi:hypothetical protein